MSGPGRWTWLAVAACCLLTGCRSERLGRELFGAIDAGDRERALALIEQGASLDSPGFAGRNALIHAACKGQVEVVRRILAELALLPLSERSVYLNHDSRGGPRTALECAAAEGHDEILSALVAAGARVGGPGRPLYQTPLIWAAQNGRLETVRLLLDSGADIDEGISEINDLTALMAAARAGQVAVVRELVARGAELEAFDSDGTALGKAARYTAPLPSRPGRRRGAVSVPDEDYVEIARILVGAGADLEAEDFHHRTALYHAVERGKRELARFLIGAGADPAGGRGSSTGSSALMAAAWRGDLESVRLLIAAGSDVGSTRGNGTALSSAAASGRVAVMQELLDAGAEVNQSVRGWPGTALGAAARAGHLEAVRYLLAQGAEVGPFDLERLGVTGDPRILELLRAASAPRSPRSEPG